MSEAMRYNDGKPKLSYFMRSFPRMAEAIARVKEMGGIKYEEGNWKKGNKPDEEYWDSMFRHLQYIFTGEEYDKDSGCLHIAHAVWNMCALHELNSTSPPIDEVVFAERATHWGRIRAEREAKEDRLERGLSAVFVNEATDQEPPALRDVPSPAFEIKVGDIEKLGSSITLEKKLNGQYSTTIEPKVKTESTCQGFCPDCTCDDCCDPDAGLGAGPEITFKPGVPYPLLPVVSKTCDIMFEIKDGPGKLESFKKLEKSLLDQHVQKFVSDAEARAVEVAIAQVTEDSKARVEKAHEEADKADKAEYIAAVKADVKLLADALKKANNMGMTCLTQEEMNKAVRVEAEAEVADAIELDALAQLLSKNEQHMEDCVETHTPDALKDVAEQTRWDQEEEV